MKRFHEATRRYNRPLFIILLIALVVVWWVRRSPYERILEIPVNTAVLEVQGNAVALLTTHQPAEPPLIRNPNGKGVVAAPRRAVNRDYWLRLLSLSGRRETRDLWKEKNVPTDYAYLATADSRIYFIQTLRRNLTARLKALPMMAPIAPAAGATPDARSATAAVTTDLCAFPLNGGKPEQVLTNLPESFSRAVVVEGQVYWVNARPDEEIPAAEKKALPTLIGHSDLMTAPLRGGEPRVLATGLLQFTQLQKDDVGLTWSKPTDRAHVALYRLRSETKQPEQIRPDAEADMGNQKFLTLKGRLYWVKPERQRPAAGQPPTTRPTQYNLLSMAENGSDPQTLPHIVTGINSEILEIRPVKAQKRWLYFESVERLPEEPGQFLYRNTLWRLDPLRDKVWEKVLRMPDGVTAGRQFEGDSYFFTMDEYPENWFDWSKKGLLGKKVTTLYRYRLPD